MGRPESKRKKTKRSLIHTTADGIGIYATTGKKSKHDFRVRFMGPHGRLRTPKHIHLIVEMYVKEARYPRLTLKLRDHLLAVYKRLAPIRYFPPRLQVYRPAHKRRFSRLGAVGEFSTEFFLIVNELIFIQEKTNYPKGSLTQKLYKAFRHRDWDRFSVIAQASWRGGVG
jgi:hypothetical protein